MTSRAQELGIDHPVGAHTTSHLLPRSWFLLRKPQEAQPPGVLSWRIWTTSFCHCYFFATSEAARWGECLHTDLALEGCALFCEFQSWLMLSPFPKPVMVVNASKPTVTHHPPISVGSWDGKNNECLVLRNKTKWPCDGTWRSSVPD